MYYNTNNESGLDLRESWYSNANQDELVLKLFQIHAPRTFTPDEIEEICNRCNRRWPITSIRRAISTLTKHGNLTKTSELREGKYGKKTHAWKYNIIQSTTQVRNDLNDTDTPGQGSNGF